MDERFSKPLRIAQISPLAESVPPRLYGGTERVVYNLTEELVHRGHDVTLFASGDSQTSARLVSVTEQALRLDPAHPDSGALHTILMDEVLSRCDDFDVIHNHIDYGFFPLVRMCRAPVVTTLHGRLDLPELEALYRHFSDVMLVSISDAQRRPVSHANFVRTVYHGMRTNAYGFYPDAGDYVAFVGRVSPEKKVDDAIRVALEAEIPIRIAAKVDEADEDYFRTWIEPMFDHPLVEFLGEVGEEEKGRLLGGAKALLFMVDWPEPFGLAMIEAMACGTPVIARRCGSVPEVVDEGVTGFVVDDVQAAARRLVDDIPRLSRERVYQRFSERFSVQRMVDDYEELYRRLTRLHSEERAAG